MQRSDLLIAVGARFDDRATGKVAEFCPRAKVIHLDVDASEIHKVRHADLPLPGDVLPTLGALLEQVPARRREAWRDEIRVLKLGHPAQVARRARSAAACAGTRRVLPPRSPVRRRGGNGVTAG